MGKSPGKWIKAKFFGRKSAISVAKKGETGKEAFIISKASSGVVAVSEPVISNPQPVVTERNGHNLANGNQTVAKLSEELITLVSGSQDGNVTSVGMTSIANSDTLNLEQAAAKVQAAVRGFLARRSFLALKGIIRLQALIRGHLVRRQAVATLQCMRGIVRFQALVRGQKVRVSEAGIEVKEKCNLEKLQLITVGILQSNRPVKISNNVYVQKLLASSPSARPLSLHYYSDDANSAWNWLERWSISHFWELVVEVKRDKALKSSRKSGANKEVELENVKPKRGVRRNASAHHDKSPDYGKPRVATKKSIIHQGEPAQENGPNELEKVKRNLRKVSLTKSESNDKPEVVIEKTKSKVSKMRESVDPIIPERLPNSSVEKLNGPTDSFLNEKQNEPSNTPAENDSDEFGTTTKEHEAAVTPHHAMEEIVVAAIDESSAADALIQSIQQDENPPVVDEILPKEDSNGKDNQKARRRRSLSTKQDYHENVPQNTPALPSYMQATESAKAKLRAQGSPRLSQDTHENGIIRRHSLPSCTLGKLNTPSPRIQKLVQGSGKGGIKSDKSLSASKDYNSNADSFLGFPRQEILSSQSFSSVNGGHQSVTLACNTSRLDCTPGMRLRFRLLKQPKTSPQLSIRTCSYGGHQNIASLYRHCHKRHGSL